MCQPKKENEAMRLRLRPTHRLKYKLKLTPQIRLSINVLQLPLLKLKEFINHQVEENPLLDKESQSGLNCNLDNGKRDDFRKSLITKPVTLREHLLSQLRIATDSDHVYSIGDFIIGNIDDDGYLKSSIKDIAEFAKAILAEVERVLYLIQSFDPIGIGSRDLRECLLLQLRVSGLDHSLAGQIAANYLPLLARKKYDYIAKKLKVTIEEVKEAVKDIARLEPKPGRSFSPEKSLYLIPDAILNKNEQGYEVMFNDWELPWLTLNAKYKKILKQKDTTEDVKKYLKERLNAANSLISAINKRKETIQKIIEEIIRVQRPVLDNKTSDFRPMTLEQIAKRISKHKSTVSRAISNKYLQTPQGIFELRYFLDSGIKQKDGSIISSKTIKFKIGCLIANEDKAKPLTDQKITDYLKTNGISVSRRAVTKYRKQLKILSSKLR